jgi:pimeloyl-ACP methyl ester carboxylesterase
MQRVIRMMTMTYGVYQLIIGTGVVTLKPALMQTIDPSLALLPPQQAEMYEALLAANPQLIGTAAQELQAIPESQAQMRAAQITTFGDLPLIVLRHGRSEPTEFTPEVAELFETTFAQRQTELAALSSRGQLVVAEQSGHNIHLEQPDLVTQAIRTVLAEIGN